MAESPRITVLGMVGVSRGSTRVPLPGGRALALLALLALDARMPSPDESLIAALGGTGDRAHATGALRVHISELRAGLTPVGLGVSRLPAGYRLDAAGASIDIDEARTHALRGELAQRLGRHEDASAAYAAALDAWEGLPLANIEAPFVPELRARLLYWHRTLRQSRMESDLALRLGPLRLAEARELCDLDPLDERAARHRMLALIQAGRRAEALEVYAETRRRLVDVLGVEPGPDLAAVQAVALAPPSSSPAQDAWA